MELQVNYSYLSEDFSNYTFGGAHHMGTCVYLWNLLKIAYNNHLGSL